MYIKATEGSTKVDYKYKKNNREAREMGMKVGAYHFFTTTSSARKQAENFISNAPVKDQDLIPMIDFENNSGKWSKKQIRDSLNVFIDIIKKHYGKDPIFYSVNSHFNKYLAQDFNTYHSMIGRYNKGKQPPTANYSIWQYSDRGRINGIPKFVDLSRFHPKYNIDILLLN